MQKYFKELLSKVYFNLKVSSLALIINATILTALFYKYVDTELLFAWYISLVGISLLRFYSYTLYKNNRTKFTLHQWQQLFYGGLISSSLLFGIAPLLFFSQLEALQQAMLIIVIAGVTAGGVNTLFPLLKGAVIFMTLLIVPLVMTLFMQGTLIHTSMALLILLYYTTILYLTKIFHGNYLELLETKSMYEEEKNRLSLSQEKFQAVFKQAPLGIVLYDINLIIQDINQEFIDFIASPREYLVGLDLHTLPDTRLFPSLSAILENREGFYEGEYITKQKRKNLWISMHTSPLRDNKGEVIGGIGIVTDITNRMLSELKFKHQAEYDALTEIPNRSYLLQQISLEMARYKRTNILFGLLFLDLDHFKNINDSLGHDAGDALLIETTQRLEKIMRESDIVARIGGDEFIILATDLSTDEHTAATKMELIAKKVHQALSTPFTLHEHKFTLSSSIGITLVSYEYEDTNDILKHADIAMYEAKKAGRNTTKFYKKDMDIWIKRRVGIENAFKDALANGEFELYYQPVVALATSKIIGAEALIRWHTTAFENLYPDEFIPIAEECGMIFEIGEWVLNTALAQFVVWQKEFPHLKRVAVNVSAYQFGNPNFLEQVASAIASTQICENALELELVESALVEDNEELRTKMQTLRNLGINISIDDFGTGYSSLSYLKNLPFSTLKIDKAFVTGLAHDSDNRKLINAIVMLAKNFNFEIIAEGVEAGSEYQFLQEKGCDYFQGYYCSRPIPAEEFRELLLQEDGSCSKL